MKDMVQEGKNETLGEGRGHVVPTLLEGDKVAFYARFPKGLMVRLRLMKGYQGIPSAVKVQVRGIVG